MAAHVDFAPGLREAVSRMSNRELRMIGPAIDAVSQFIPPGERVDFASEIAVLTSSQDGFNALMVITDNLVIIVAALGWKGRNVRSAVIPYTQIDGVESDGRGVSEILISHAGGQLLLSKEREVAATIVEELRSRALSTRAPAPSEPDPLELLARLAELRDAGVVTEEEFAAKKAKLLNEV